MKPKEMLAELESAASAIDVKVSYESIATAVMRGGLCKVKGQYRVIIDKRLNAEERANTLAESLARFDFSKLESVAKGARSLLDYYANRRNLRMAQAS
ncbi:MAG: hypothetical protein GY811_11760 [Myxococcales bacterium]|nr:hypothetical protein [Myxococcales bacterium]